MASLSARVATSYPEIETLLPEGRSDKHDNVNPSRVRRQVVTRYEQVRRAWAKNLDHPHEIEPSVSKQSVVDGSDTMHHA